MVVKDPQWDVLSWTLWIQRYRDQPDMLRLHHFSLLHQTILLWQSNECFSGEDWRWLNFHDIIMHSWGRSHHNDNCCSSDMVPTEEKSCILIITSEYHGVSTAGIRRWPDRLWPGLRFFLELSGVYSVFAGRRLHHTITWYKPEKKRRPSDHYLFRNNRWRKLPNLHDVILWGESSPAEMRSQVPQQVY